MRARPVRPGDGSGQALHSSSAQALESGNRKRTNGLRRASRWREKLQSPELVFLMGAHDGLSARIAEVEGFDAVWASGLSVSTALGVRDTNEISWSQLLDVVSFMVDATTIPIVVDGDTGFGDFNNARRFVRKAEQAGAAGVCFEDKVFPKMNSFVGDAHCLATIPDFEAKIYAAKESQTDTDFCVIARTEALIAERGMAEALARGEAYRLAGADALFIHSRRSNPSEIAMFATEWAGRLPLVIAPTTYASTPTDVFRRLGISVLIWANHNVRAATAAMRQLCRELRGIERADQLRAQLASLEEVFELMDYAELEEAERRFLTRHATTPT